MQILNFTQKLLRQRSFLSSLIPLLALFVGLGASQTVLAQTFNFDDVTINSGPNGSATTTTFDGTLDPNGTNDAFDPMAAGTGGNRDLGNGFSFNQATGTLTLTNANINASTPAANPITAARLKYRVYATGTTMIPVYQVLNLMRTSINNTGNANSPVIFGAPAGTNIDLLRQPQVLGSGNYTVDIQFQFDYTFNNRGTLGTRQVTDPSSGTGIGFRAFFQVLAPPVTPPGATTRWISNGTGAMNTNWLNPANWSNGVPTRNSNANIPGKDFAAGDPFTVSPLLNNPTAIYEVQNLTLERAANNVRALVRVGQSVDQGGAAGSAPVGATLRIYGDLNNLGSGILASVSGTNGSANPATNSTILFAGDNANFTLDPNTGAQISTGGRQIIRGLLTAVDVRIEGTGAKGVINDIVAANTFIFNTTNARVRTIFEDLTLNTSKTASIDLRDSGTLSGETVNAFIEGITLSDRSMRAGVPQDFGNIGITITPNRDILAPNVFITRTIGVPFNGPAGTAAVAIKRQYGVSGDVNNNTISTVKFNYLDSPDELNGNPEPRLTMFRTGNNGVPFAPLGGDVNVADNSVTAFNVRSINTVTLGNKDNPLPVLLTSFDAKRVGADAVVTWETANEQNSRGFDVQVSTNGREFRTIGTLASRSPNSSTPQNYRFVDSEENKTGLRYYRLRQVDVDGKTAVFSPRVVNFTNKIGNENKLAAYPMPFTNELRLDIYSTTEGAAVVTMLDMTGRAINTQNVTLSTGTNDVPLGNMAGLNSGIYVLRMVLPSGVVQSTKVVKQ